MAVSFSAMVRVAPSICCIAASICANVPLGIWLTKQSLWLNQGVGSLEAACEIEARAVFMAQASEDAAEKRKAFVEKRAPVFANR